MNDLLNTVSPAKISRQWRAVLWGGMLAGALDLASAFILHGSPMRVSQSIASGVLGAGAYQGGVVSAALGVLLHFGIILVAAWCFCRLSQRLGLLLQQPLLAALLCGLGVYLAMHLLVLPLSLIPFKLSYTVATVARDLAIHVVLVGLPIALAARYFYSSKD